MKQPLTIDTIKALAKDILSCGDCRGLNRNALLPTADKTCAAQGQVEDAKICKHFRTNVYDIREAMKENGDKLVAIFQLFNGLEQKDLRLLAGMLLSEHKTRAIGFVMGQPVFVRIRGREGRNYINNFAACRVLDADENEVRLITEDGATVLTYPLDSKSVYTKKEFMPLLKEMRKENKLIDPEKNLVTPKSYLPEEDVTFSAPNSLDGMSVPMMNGVIKKGKKRIKTTNTLIDLVGMIEGGQMEGSFSDDDEAHDLDEDKYETYAEVDDKPKKKKKKKKPGVVKGKKLRKNKDGSINLEDML